MQLFGFTLTLIFINIIITRSFRTESLVLVYYETALSITFFLILTKNITFSSQLLTKKLKITLNKSFLRSILDPQYMTFRCKNETMKNKKNEHY